MLVAIECTQPGTKQPVGGKPSSYPAKIARHCFDNGLIARALWECVALAPPLCTTLEEADRIADCVIAAFAEVGSGATQSS